MQAELINPAIGEEYSLRLLELINRPTEDFVVNLTVSPHLCQRVHPAASVLGVCIRCGQLGVEVVSA